MEEIKMGVETLPSEIEIMPLFCIEFCDLMKTVGFIFQIFLRSCLAYACVLTFPYI